MQKHRCKNYERNMHYNVVMSNAADYDLDQILNYISVELNNSIAASNFLNKLSHCFTLLSEQPRAYALSDYPYLFEKGYRKCVIDHYIMLYRINEEKQEVFILRFFYGRQDYIKYL